MTKLSTTILVAMMAALTQHPAVPAEYTILDLGTLGGGASTAYAVNAAGQVTGASITSQGDTHAFRTAPNSPINPTTDDLGTLGGSSSFGYAINDSGQVAGSSRDVGGALRAFVTGANAPINAAEDNLGVPEGGTVSEALGINNQGQVVGFVRTGQGVELPFFWDGSLHVLSVHSGYGRDINNAGTILFDGRFQAADAPGALLLTSDEGLYDLAVPIRTGQTTSTGLSENGLAVGWQRAPDNFHYEAWLWNGETSSILPSFVDDLEPRALGVNSAGVAVGQSYAGAVIWSNGGIEPLQDLLPEGSGWTLYAAQDINDNGQIVGYGLHNGESHAFLMTPCPDESPLEILSVVVSPALAIPGQDLVVTVTVSDAENVSEVLVDGNPAQMVAAGVYEAGMVAAEALGEHMLTVRAVDLCENAVEQQASYTTGRVVGTAIKNTRILPPGAEQNFLFRLWGLVKSVQQDRFVLDDGSPEPVEVLAQGHEVQSGQYVTAWGRLDLETGEPVLQSAAAQVSVLDP